MTLSETKRRVPLTLTRLLEVLSYDPLSGEFRGLVGRPGIQIGDLAGRVNNRGYLTIGIDGKRYQAHRLAFLYMTGKSPSGGVDHADCDRLNNRWANLREATHSSNGANRGPQRNSTSGVKGVYWDNRKGKWDARITVRGRQIFIGLFDAKEDARAAYMTASIKHFGEFANSACGGA